MNFNKYIKISSILIFLIISLSAFAQEEDESPCTMKPSKKAVKIYEQAIEKLKIGDYYETSVRLKEVLEMEPEYLDALWLTADVNTRIRNKIAKKSLAIEAYEKIVNICPEYENYYSYFHLANLYYENEKYAEAHKMYEAFLGAKTDKIKEKDFEIAEINSKYTKFYSEIYAKTVPFNPQLVKGINTEKDEYMPYITPDNQYAYFTRKYEEKRVGAVSSGDSRIERFIISERINGTFNIGTPLDYPFNQQPNEGGACLTIDNKELFYTRCIVLNTNQYFNCDICYTKFENGSWSEIVELPEEINQLDSWESQPTISSDGKTLLFISDRSGGLGGYDIYMSTRDTSGKWSKAVNMGPTINSAGNEKSPFLHSDSKTLYFSSADREIIENGVVTDVIPGHLGIGGYDIFFTRLDGKNSWISPKNIGYPINSEDNEISFFVSTDGKTGYFAKKGFLNAKDWNIYSFELYPEAQPQKVLFIKGQLKDEETKSVLQEASIEIKNVKTKEITSIPVNKTTGEYAAVMLLNTDYTMTVKKEGYTYVTKYIGEEDKAFQIPVNMNVTMQAVQVGKTYNLDDIYFDTDKDVLTASSLKVIEGFFEFLLENPKVKVEIQGHTDNIGSDEYNFKLSEDRAKTVYELLISMGIPSNRMHYRGYGESKPIANNETEEGRQKNRRTVFVITAK